MVDADATILETFIDLLLPEPPEEAWAVVTADGANTFRLTKFASKSAETFDLGIREASAGSFAAGLASTGRKTLLIGFAAFMLRRAYESLHLYCGEENIPLVILGGMPGLTAARDGVSHHALDDLALAQAADADMRILMPGSRRACEMSAQIAASCKSAVYVRVAREPVFVAPNFKQSEPIDGAILYSQSGNRNLAVSYGSTLSWVPRHIPKSDVLEVWDLRAAVELPDLFGKYEYVTVYEEHQPFGSLHQSIELRGRVRRSSSKAIRHSPGSGVYESLLDHSFLTSDGVKE
jgi:transketolase C-terminal domain/subunit